MKVYKLLSITLIMCMLIPFTVGCSYFKATESINPSLGIHSLGCIKDDIKSKSSSNRTITLELKKGDKVKFQYDSNVKEGTLKIQLIRSKNDVIQDFPINKSGTEELVMNKDERCMLLVDFDNFIGDFKIYGDKIS